MKCPNCRRDMEKAWNYCPNCGSRFRRDFFSSIFNRMFSGMDQELKQMNHIMDKRIEALDLSPFFGNRPIRVSGSPNPRGSGFTIRITKSGGPPRVSVRAFGNLDQDKLRERVQTQLGIPGPGPKAREGPENKPTKAMPKSVEEPRTEVKRLPTGVAVSMEMPGVKSLDDISIRELESSLEVRARAGEKSYFKILTKPGHSRLSRKAFTRGILNLEFS